MLDLTYISAIEAKSGRLSAKFFNFPLVKQYR